jgi:hypothetical protein
MGERPNFRLQYEDIDENAQDLTEKDLTNDLTTLERGDAG